VLNITKPKTKETYLITQKRQLCFYANLEGVWGEWSCSCVHICVNISKIDMEFHIDLF